MQMSEPSHDKPTPKDETQVACKTISAEELFDGEREILIEHEGEIYRLRITRRNKLILQK